VKVRLTHIDGKLPNLALMKLAWWHTINNDQVWFSRSCYRDLFEPPEFDRVYGSSIFTRSVNAQRLLKQEFPEAILGGTGTDNLDTVDSIAGKEDWLDYSIYSGYRHSIGFSQRGCRLKCKFCVVPSKEGKIRNNRSVHEIWRGQDYPKEIVLLDNDFFGQDDWEEKSKEIIDGEFKVCFCQGLNVRLIHEDGARYLAQMKYYNSEFTTRRLYTAYDNPKDEKIFHRGFNILMDAGIKPRHVMVYMLVGYWPGETIDDCMERYQQIKSLGALAYPMVYNDKNKELKKFQRWVIRRYDQYVPWNQYDNTI
jgi:hypothetical protein